jgi:lipoprotein-anchoring transpeptidase ErfK/SrfK
MNSGRVTMKRNSRTIALATAVAAVASGLAGCGSGDSSTPGTPTPSAVAASKPLPAHPSQRLQLGRRGQPIVWLKRHASIPIRTEPGGRVIKRLGSKTEFGSRTVLAVFSHRGPWAGVPTPLLPNGRLGWVKLAPSRLRAGWTRYLVDVDLSARRVRLRLGRRVLRSFAATVGAPGSPTPIGRFAVTDTFRANLNPAYGCCAVATTATQPHLPSGWLGGNRIAIHGTQGPLGLAASHGCVRAANRDVSALVNRVPLGTPVAIHG